MRRSFLPAFVLLALAQAACTPRDVLPDNVCGNGVIDVHHDKDGVEQGEDCDTQDKDGFHCVPAGEPWACAFKCNEDGQCPAGYGCGTDSICRRPTAIFDRAPFASGPSQAQELLAGDFDADGVADIVGVEPGRLRINFAEPSGAVQQLFLSANRRPSVGKLGALSVPKDKDESGIDKTDDLMIPLDLGLGALVSNGNRTFSPKTYGSITFTGLPKTPEGKTVEVIDAIPMAFDALPDAANHPGDETVALFQLRVGGEDQPNGAFATFSTGGSGPVFDVAGAIPKTLFGSPVIADFDDDPCEEIAFPHRSDGADKSDLLLVYKACVKGKNDGEWEWRSMKSPGSAVLAAIDVGGRVSGPGYAYDVNFDGNADLLITVDGDFGRQLNIAFSLGNGKFDSQDPTLGPAMGNNQARFYGSLDGDEVLTFGLINEDWYVDVVEANRVLFGYPAPDEQLVFYDVYAPTRPWTEALLAHMNGDGLRDVVASTKGAANIDIVYNTGTSLWNPFTLSTDGTVEHLTAGDFDGDLVTDIVFRDVLTPTQSLLAIAYGRTSGGPEAPVTVGTFPDVVSITAGDVAIFGSDAITDIGVVSHISGDLSLSFFPGASNRVMQTPYLLADKLNQVHVPVQGGIGFLRPWDPKSGEEAHRDVATLSYAPPRINEQGDPIEELEKYRTSMHLWGLVGAGEASFSSQETVICPMPKGSFLLPSILEASAVVLSDVTPGQVSDVLVVTPYIEYIPEEGLLDVETLVAKAHFDGMTCSVDKPFRAQSGQLLFRPRMVDLNGNGAPELLAIEGDYDPFYLSLLLFQASNDPGTTVGPDAKEGLLETRFVIFWDGDLGKGDALTPVAPDGQPSGVTDFTVGDVDGDGSPEVIVVGDGSPAVYKIAEGGAALEATSTPAGLDIAGARAVLLADGDGDGVKDMAIAAGSQLQIFRAQVKVEPHSDEVSAGTRQ